MSQELEAAAGAAAGSLFRRRGAELPVGTPCPNCATPLEGPWCYRCGQLGEDFHRSTWRLIAEAFEGLLHFDSRLWRTLPDLFGRPARLTRAFLEGHRAPQIPPFRLFLVVLVLVFFAGALGGSDLGQTGGGRTQTVVLDTHGKLVARTNNARDLTPQQRAMLRAGMEKGLSRVAIGDAGFHAWIVERTMNALDDPARFKLVIEQWSERFAFLSLPLAAGLLSLVFVFQRRFFVYDHVVFSLHSLSAMGLMIAANKVLADLTGGLTTLAILIGAPVHLFAHLRGVYRTSVIGTLLRMLVIAIGSLVGLAAIMLGLILDRAQRDGGIDTCGAAPCPGRERRLGLVEQLRRGQVLDHVAEGFVDRDLLGRLAARLGAVENLADLGDDMVVVDEAGGLGVQELRALGQHARPIVGDEAGARDEVVGDFGGSGPAGADGVDVSAVTHLVGEEDRGWRGGHGANDIRPGDGFADVGGGPRPPGRARRKGWPPAPAPCPASGPRWSPWRAGGHRRWRARGWRPDRPCRESPGGSRTAGPGRRWPRRWRRRCGWR